MVLDEKAARDINRDIKRRLKQGKPVKVLDLKGLDCIAAGINIEAKVFVEGYAGDFFGAFNCGGVITLSWPKGTGTKASNHIAGNFVGNNMLTGGIVIHGDVGDFCGHNMHSGVIIIEGNCNALVGARMKGGVIIVKGDCGDMAGAYMLGGDTIILGNSGKNLGEDIRGGAVYIKGDYKSLGFNAVETDLNEMDMEKLETYFTHYNIQVDVSEFKKIVPKRKVR